jgi:hypothetical protein
MDVPIVVIAHEYVEVVLGLTVMELVFPPGIPAGDHVYEEAPVGAVKVADCPKQIV